MDAVIRALRPVMVKNKKYIRGDIFAKLVLDADAFDHLRKRLKWSSFEVADPKIPIGTISKKIEVIPTPIIVNPVIPRCGEEKVIPVVSLPEVKAAVQTEKTKNKTNK